MFSKNPLNKFEQNRFHFNLDEYVDLAIREAIGAGKVASEPGKTLNDAAVSKINAIAVWENIMAGLGYIEEGENEVGVKTEYQQLLDREKEVLARTPKGEQLQKKLQFANLRFKLFFRALKREKVVTVELKS